MPTDHQAIYWVKDILSGLSLTTQPFNYKMTQPHQLPINSHLNCELATR
jgi:hypothetical protein